MPERCGLILDSRGDVSGLLAGPEFQEWRFRRALTIDAAERALAAECPQVGLVVVESPGCLNLRELEALVSRHPAEWVAILGPDMRHDEALRAMLVHAFHDYHTLPVDVQRLRVTVGHAYGRARLTRELGSQLEDLGRYGMTGRSPAMLSLYRQIDKVVKVNAPVLITGESGSGKELVARAIHQHSARAGGPFVAMNCGALAPNLVQAELFGHEKGAFTGAHQRKIGNVEAANGGILFLDEIGDLPLDLQANLLRFLQEKTIVRLGATQRISVDVRVIAATHVDLAEAVSAGRFREDLYYRLHVLHLAVPPLRERLEDVPALAETAFREHYAQRSLQVKGFSQEALKAMQNHGWPGNVRELVNRVHKAMIMTEHRLICAADLGLGVLAPVRDGITLQRARASLDKEVIEGSLRTSHNNVSQAARQLGVSRVTLYRLMNKLNIIL